MRPGVEVISRAQPLPRSAPTDTGAAFMVGATSSGPAYKLVRSLTEYEATFGPRTGGQDAYDCAEAFFREGGAKLTVSRTNPSVLLTVAEPEGGDITDEALSTMSRADLNALAEEHGITDAESLPNREAVIAAIREQVSEAEREALTAQQQYDAALFVADPGVTTALLALVKSLGPGQVFIAGPLAEAVDNQTALLAHAQVNNRFALLNPADGTASALTAAATALRTDVNARYGALFAPKALIPGLAGGTSRTVPYTALVAGMIARNDPVYGPNVPSAGDLGQALFATDITTRYTDAEYQSLNDAGVDMARLVYGGVRTYGWRTLVDPASAAGVWLSIGNARLNMDITAEAEAIGEHYLFTQLDGRRRTISQFGGALRAMLVPFWEAGQLYGDTAQDAFQVNVGESVNTPESIANGELHAVLQVRMSPFAEWVVIEIVKVSTTQALAA